MDLRSVACRRSYTIEKLAVLCKYDELGGNISAYSIRLEQAEEHTGLTIKEERRTMKTRRMKTEKVKHCRVDYTIQSILHLDEKVCVLVFNCVSSINI